MAMESSTETTLDLRLPSAVKVALAQAAAQLGQSVDELPPQRWRMRRAKSSSIVGSPC
jgi:hypothetical protein